MNTHLQEGILSTVAFFDALGIALTDAEVYELGFDAPSKPMWDEFKKNLDLLLQRGHIERSGGSIVLPHKKQLVEERIASGLFSEHKFTLACRAARLIRCIPFVRMIAVCNTLSFDMSRSDGDVDLFIVAEARHVHIVHSLTTFVLHVLSMRRHGFHIANRMCLSFYVAKDGMDLSRFALDGKDPYLAQWVRHVIPLFSIRSTAEQFWDANKNWLTSYFSQPAPYIPGVRRRVSDIFLSRIVRVFFESILSPFAGILESWSLNVQKKKMERSAKRRMRSQPHDVVVDEQTLKFHEEDRRAFYRDRMDATLNAWRAKNI